MAEYRKNEPRFSGVDAAYTPAELAAIRRVSEAQETFGITAVESSTVPTAREAHNIENILRQGERVHKHPTAGKDYESEIAGKNAYEAMLTPTDLENLHRYRVLDGIERAIEQVIERDL